MKVSLKTLANYVDISKFSVTEIAEKITSAGIEVASITPQVVASNLEIGQIIKVEKHPSADTLNVCQVQLKDSITQIVCGAPNVKEQLKVIVAKPGAVLFNDVLIKKSIIRDVESNGMMCALYELGVPNAYLTEYQLAGIEELDDQAPIGNDPIAYLDLDDLTIELDLTPNRPDCLGILDFAYEIAAIFEQPLKLPQVQTYKAVPTSVKLDVDTDLAPRFVVFKLNHIQVAPSPAWLKNRLMAMGVKSINNIVDIANYVMLVTGQPIHTYDAQLLNNDSLAVRKTADRLFLGLDGHEYQTQDDIGIFSADKLVGLAGIMGSESSKISATTKDIIIEAATFESPLIRKTSKRIALHTDASTRFVKGINEDNEALVISMLTELFMNYANSEKGIEVEETLKIAPKPFVATDIAITLKEINDTLMLDLTIEQVEAIFNRLKFNFEKTASGFTVKTLSRRKDIEQACDLIEEVARLYGYDNLKSVLPNVQPETIDHDVTIFKVKQLKHMLSQLGLYEAINYSLVDFNDANILKFDEMLKLVENSGRVKQYMRQSLLPSLMGNLKHNHAYSSYNTSLFEVSNVYGLNESKTLLTCVMQGEYHQSLWQHERKQVDFYVIKAILEKIMAFLGIEGRVQLKAGVTSEQIFHDYQCATVLVDYKEVGVIGRLHPLYEANYDVKNCYAFELDLNKLLDVKASKIKYKALSRYQSVQRDLSLIVKNDIIAADIVSTVNKAAKKLATNVKIFDVYVDDSYKAQGLKSMGVAITLQSSTKTLNEQDISQTMKSIIDALLKQGIEIRGI